MTLHVLYNGATGGLGRHLGAALERRSLAPWPISSRLGDSIGFIEEVTGLPIEPGSRATFVQSAGMVSIKECEENADEAFDINVNRTTATVEAFLDWAVAHEVTPSIVFVSSGHVYAPPPAGARISETSPIDPRSVYAKTEVEGENRVRALAGARGVPVAICRVFGMIGPDQRHHYLLPGLIRRIVTDDLNGVPGLDYVRDYLDTRDVSRLLASLVATRFDEGVAPPMTVLNVCSGEETRIGDMLDTLITLYYAEDVEGARKARSAVSAAPGRATDIPWSVGDPALLTSFVDGPIRTITVADTLADALATRAR
jgi:nucleoside-diphosphate-sugar epimerase